MKPKNFPARKLARKLKAQSKSDAEIAQAIGPALTIRTKKDRRSRAKISV